MVIIRVIIISIIIIIWRIGKFGLGEVWDADKFVIAAAAGIEGW